MKRKIILPLLLLCVLLCGCSSPESNPKPEASTPCTETYIIPNSFWEYSGTKPEDAVDTFFELGDDYYTSAKVVDEGVQVELTELQRDNLIQRNNDYNERLIADFMAYNSEYWYVPDENYQRLAFYFDEKIPGFLNVKTVYNLAAGYGMNYILQNNTVDWNVEISIYNCHTGKLVASVNSPYETVSYGPEEWQKSYEE